MFDFLHKKISGKTYEEILSQVVDAVVSIDEHNNVTFFNKAAEELWGYSSSEILGKSMRILLPTSIRHDHDDYINANRTTGINKIVGSGCDIKIERKDGTSAWGNLSLTKAKVGKRQLYTAFIKDITKERQQREILNQTLEQALDAVVSINERNNITFFNRAAESLWGYSRQEVLGKNVKMLVPDMIQSQHDKFINANRKTGQDKIVGTCREVEIQRKDRSKIWGSLSLSKIKVGDALHYTAFVKDITQERENREIINQTLEQAIDAVVTIDKNNLITFYNQSAEKLWGYNKEEVIGKNVKMLVPHIHQSKHDDYVNNNRRSGVDKIVGTSREVLIERKDGQHLYAILSLSKIQSANHIGYTAFVRNVTAERESRETTNAAMESVMQSSNQIEDILSVINIIADQTRMLSLNASIEASRAGEQGKGFAVVANEVRTLAEKSADSSHKIDALVNETKDRINELAKALKNLSSHR